MSNPSTFGARAKLKDVMLDSVWIKEVNKIHNKDWSLYNYYQINPYTKTTMDYVTRKVNERRPKLDFCKLPGYCGIRGSIWKPHCDPQTKKCHPQTEMQGYGWFPDGTVLNGEDRCDERFNFKHITPEFVKTGAKLRDHDKLMKKLVEATAKPP